MKALFVTSPPTESDDVTSLGLTIAVFSADDPALARNAYARTVAGRPRLSRARVAAEASRTHDGSCMGGAETSDEGSRDPLNPSYFRTNHVLRRSAAILAAFFIYWRAGSPRSHLVSRIKSNIGNCTARRATKWDTTIKFYQDRLTTLDLL